MLLRFANDSLVRNVPAASFLVNSGLWIQKQRS